jgi:hypothetical protein
VSRTSALDVESEPSVLDEAHQASLSFRPRASVSMTGSDAPPSDEDRSRPWARSRVLLFTVRGTSAKPPRDDGTDSV